MHKTLFCTLLVMGGCGRLGFDSQGLPADASIDANAVALDAARVVGIDPTFGEGGVVIVDRGGIDNVSWSVHGIAIQPDGRILIASRGGTPTDLDAMVIRLLDDGAVDLSFGTDGVALVDFNAFDSGHGLALQPDGRILLGINALIDDGASAESAVARLNANGTLDTSFGVGGIREVNFVGDVDASNGVFVGIDGKIVFGGQSCCAATGFDMALARLNADGSLDPSFGIAGIAGVDLLGFDEFGTPVAMLADGRILGVAKTWTGSGFDMALVRYLENGSLDPSFGTAGVASTDFGGADAPGDAIVLAGGKSLMVGATRVNDIGDFAISRHTVDGVLDGTFANSGRYTLDLGGDDSLGAALQLPDGRLVVGGRTDHGGDQDFVILVLNPDGTHDSSVGSNGVFEIDVMGNQEDRVWGLALDTVGRVLILGETADDTGSGDIVCMRLVL